MARNPKQTGRADGDARRPARARSKKPSRAQAARRKAKEVQVRRPDRASRIIAFIEQLIVPSGEGQGGRFRLREWQKKFIRDIYEPHGSNGLRRVRRAILSIARKNGKTALIAALVLVHLVGPESVQNGEIYSAANDREQAAQVFKMAAQMVRADPELNAADGGLLKIVDSTKHIACYSNGSFYKAMSAEAGTKHGLNPTFVIFDELAQAKSRELYDVLDTSMGARSEPLFAVISTQSNDPEHILSKLIDDGIGAKDPTIVCHLYEVPEDCKNIFDPKVWKKANPALGDFRSLADLKAISDKAKRMPAEEPKFRNLYLNQRVAPIASLVSRAEWMACVGDAVFFDKEDVYLALDMSAIVDLTALVMGSAGDQTRIKPFIWKPEELLAEHSNRDFGSGNSRYVQWRNEGHLLISPGRSIDPAVIALKVAELVNTYNVLALAYDRWRIADILREFDRIGLQAWEDKGGEKKGAGLRLVPWGQGFKDMAPAIDALELQIIDRNLVHPSNPVLTWSMANAVATTDPAGNRKLDKDKARFRIDPAVALTMLCGLKSRDRKDDALIGGFLSSPLIA
jgi:phage terminase large subunit-like protein